MTSDLAKLPIVDSHQHLWNLNHFSLPWLSDPSYRAIARNFAPADYAAATAGFNVIRTVYLEVDAQPGDHAAETDYITELATSPGSPIGGAVFGCRPATDSFAEWTEQLTANPVAKGVREVLFDRPPGHCLNPEFIRSIRRLADQGLLFEIETPPDQLPFALTLVDDCPDTQFVLDHCGHPKLGERDSNWEYSIANFAKRNNVVVKISGLFSGVPAELCTAETIAPAIGRLLDVFGPDRVLFGSDWPVVTLSSSFAAWTEAVWQITQDRSASDVQKLFHDNALAIYRLA